jgi:hypothetical protein
MGAGVSVVSSLGTLTALLAQPRQTQQILRSLASYDAPTLERPYPVEIKHDGPASRRSHLTHLAAMLVVGRA